MTDLSTYGIIDIMKKCFECEKTEDQIEIHDHHVVPKSRGGTKTIPLCYMCHAIVHNKKAVSIKELTKAALKERKEKGFRIGTVPWGYNVGKDKKLITNPEEQRVISIVKDLRSNEKSWRYIAESLNQQGITNRAGRNWSAQNLWIIFKDKIREEKQ